MGYPGIAATPRDADMILFVYGSPDTEPPRSLEGRGFWLCASGRELPTLERMQWDYIHAVLDCCRGNVSDAARRLHMHRQSLQRMLRRNPPSDEPAGRRGR